MTILFFKALELPPPRASSRPDGEPITVLLPRLPPAPARVQAQPAPRKAPPRSTVSLAPTSSPAPSSEAGEPAKLPAALVPHEAEASAPPSEPRPATLDIDSKVLRSAVRASASPVRNMAGAAGVELGTPTKSVGQAHAESIARSGKADCLAPDQGASLLSVFVIAYEAATGKCR